MFMQTVILLGLTAASFYLLYRYAEYGIRTSGNARLEKTEEEPGERSVREKAEKKMAKEAQEKETIKRERTGEGMLVKTDTDTVVRVQILGDDYQGDFHQSIQVLSEDGFVIEAGGGETVVPAGRVWEITAEQMKQEYDNISCLTLTPQNGGTLVLPKLARAEKNPAYCGLMKIYQEEEGLELVNELELEEYLCSVVSSEMPSDYPQEALRAQAVCARTYAIQCIEQEKNQNSCADLDDSVSFQVYNNYQKNDATTLAVQATLGEILTCDQVLYYSTSCLTEGRTDLGGEEAFRKFLESEPDADAEYGSPWVRWSVLLPGGTILEKLRELYGCTWNKLERISIQKRDQDGQVQEALFSCGDDQLAVKGEYAVRQVFSPEEAELFLRDGTVVKKMQLLPSAYFYLCQSEDGDEGWKLLGGGYGHGQGMSQYGAAAMAASGADYREILEYYYGDNSGMK